MKTERGKQISYNITYMWNLENGIDELICKIETQTQRTNMDTKRGNGRDVMNWKIGVDI